jgi:phospholipid:diacylglycerol acyltransferase
MISQVTFNRDKWISAMMLDPITGLDPPDVKIRAAEGINAASSFIQGYWIWFVSGQAFCLFESLRIFMALGQKLWRTSPWSIMTRIICI